MKISDLITKLIITSAAFFLLSQQARAQISVNDVIIHFQSGQRPVHNVIVKNSSEEVLYVTVKSDRIEKPGEDKTAYLQSDNMLVSPQKFSIDAKGERSVRIVMKKPPAENEEVYRVMFVPQDKNFGDDIEQSPNSPKAVLRVLTGMGILVFADPSNAAAKLTWQRSGGKITFRNDGNIHVRLVQGKACIKENEGCIDLPTKRVYGRTSYTIDVDSKKTLYITTREGSSGDFQNIVIPPA